MKERIFENLGYIGLIGLIVAQCVIGKWYLVGQGIYLFCNLIFLSRSFILKRPRADKVKDTSCTAITIGLIILALKQLRKLNYFFFFARHFVHNQLMK